MKRSLIVFSCTTALLLSGCAGTRIGEIGKAPTMSRIQNPAEQEEVRTVRVPMPEPRTATLEPNAMWHETKTSFFRDQRAKSVGDILTVVIDIDDEAQLNNSTLRRRNSETELGLNGLFGLPGALESSLGGDFQASQAVGIDSDTDTMGQGSVNRNEEIKLRIGAIVTQRLPNGNFVIAGRQEVRVNFELRELVVAGLVRPQDIDFDNTIDYSKIAEARISYGGRGQITDVQQPRYGQQVLDIILPF